MQEVIEMMRSRLADLEILIAETEKRMPAHSAKPPVMMDLFVLEDERDALLKKLSVMQD